VVEGNSLAHSAYWRIGLRGIIAGLARSLASYAVVRALHLDPSRDSVTYSLSWV
jgi:hypothetical protein